MIQEKCTIVWTLNYRTIGKLRVFSLFSLRKKKSVLGPMLNNLTKLMEQNRVTIASFEKDKYPYYLGHSHKLHCKSISMLSKTEIK